jgi:hypothetical protein
MHPHSQTHHVGIVIDQLSTSDGKIYPMENYLVDIDIARGPDEAAIRELLAVDGSALVTRMYKYAEAIRTIVKAAAEEGVMLTIQQIADPHKTVTAKCDHGEYQVPALGMGFGMSVINARPARNIVSINYEMMRENLEAFKARNPELNKDQA